MFKATSISTDIDNKSTFVASMEAKKFPFLATMFHPEKGAFLEESNET